MYEHLSTDSETIRSAKIQANHHNMKQTFEDGEEMACQY